MKFGIRNYRKSLLGYCFFFLRNPYREYHTLFTGVSEFQSVISHPFSCLLGIWSIDLLIIVLNICDFRENRRRESRTFLMALHDVTWMWTLLNTFVALKVKTFLQPVYYVAE